MKLNNKLTNLFILSASLLGIVACGAPTTSNPDLSVPPSTTPSNPTGDEETTIYDCFDPSRPSGENLDYVSRYEPLDPPMPPVNTKVPMDPAYESGAPTTKYRMEAECADIHYVNNSNDVTKDTFSDYYNTAFSHLLSNNLATRNLNAIIGTTLTFKFTSSAAYKVKLNIMISAVSDKYETFNVGSYISISNKGVLEDNNVQYTPDLSLVSFNYADAVPLVSGGNVNDIYWRFKEVQTEVCIYEGQNELVIEMLGGGGANLDYIELDSSATFNGFNNNHYNDDTSRWYISKTPNDTVDGTITVEKDFDGKLKKYSYGIPAIKDANGNVNSFYKETIDGTAKTYSFKVKNETLSFTLDEADVTTLTIDDENVKFANGSKTLSKLSGEILTTEDLMLIDGRYVYEFDVYNASTNENMGVATVGSYEFPSEDVILKPRTYVRDGFTVLDPISSQGQRRPASVKVDGVQTGTAFNVTKFVGTGPLGSKAVGQGIEGMYAESGAEFSYPGTLPQGAVFRADTVVDKDNAVITVGKAHQWAYTFRNSGENPISLRLNQVNAKATIEPGDAGVELVLQPGEAKQFVITMTFTTGADNKNALSLFTVLEDTVDMKLEMAISCKLAK